MIKISVHELTQEGITEKGTLEPEFIDIADDLIQIKKELAFDLKAYLINNGALIKGKLDITIHCTCPRCLEEFDKTICEEEVCHFYEKPLPDELDITDDIREDILLDLPQNAICSPDCKGLCPKCGENLNKKSCKCSQNGGSGGVWSELDKLKC